MTSFLNAIKEFRHPEAPRTATSKEAAAAMQPALRFDETVDLAIAEAPRAVLFRHLIGIGATRTDLRAVRAVLHDGPVRAHPRGAAVERDRDIGHEMDAA